MDIRSDILRLKYKISIEFYVVSTICDNFIFSQTIIGNYVLKCLTFSQHPYEIREFKIMQIVHTKGPIILYFCSYLW